MKMRIRKDKSFPFTKQGLQDCINYKTHIEVKPLYVLNAALIVASVVGFTPISIPARLGGIEAIEKAYKVINIATKAL